MRASEKMKAFGMERLAAETGRSLSIVYRWAKAIDGGVGIRDANKRRLIEATRGTEFALDWSDFLPPAEAEAA